MCSFGLFLHFLPLLRYNFHRVINTQILSVQLMSFVKCKCVISTPDQGGKHFHNPRKFPLCPFPANPPSPRQPFFCGSLITLAQFCPSVYFINGVLGYMFFVSGFLHSVQRLEDSSMLLHVGAVSLYSYYNAYSMG